MPLSATTATAVAASPHGRDLPLRNGAGLWRLRRTTFANTVAGKVAQSRLRTALILFFTLVFWGGLFVIFWDGFHFLARNRLINSALIEMLFGLFFMTLTVMLVFSAGILLYAGLFASPEAMFLLVRPVRAELVFAYKFAESLFFSSWGLLLLASPMMLAYGLTVGAPWTFYPVSLCYFLAFVFIPAGVGAILCLLFASLFPRRMGEALALLIVAVIGGAGYWGYTVWQAGKENVLTRSWLLRVIDTLDVSNLPLLPSTWVSKGIRGAAIEGGFHLSFMYLLVVVSNAAMLYLVCSLLYGRFYRRAYDRVNSASLSRRKRSGRWLSRLVDVAFAPLSRPIRVLLVKDIRIFLRDPVQWSQVLIFVGLFAFYALNLQRVSSQYTESPYWQNLIGFFNLAVTGLLLATFTSRFIFPLFSLEGQRFWIIGLCPVSRDEILWGKFAFAAGGAVLVTGSLTLLGATMLDLGPQMLGVHLFTIVVLCFGVSGISVGLGARFPELDSMDPSRIAAGFGGTLNLVLTLAFIGFVIFSMALPCHLYAAGLAARSGELVGMLGVVERLDFTLARFRFWLAVSIAVTLAVGIVATLVPMRLGIKALRRMEF